MLLKLKGKRNHGFKTAWRKGFGKRSEVNLKSQSSDGVLVHSFMATPLWWMLLAQITFYVIEVKEGYYIAKVGGRSEHMHVLNTVGLTPVCKQLIEQEF